MIIHEETTEPVSAMVNGVPQTVRQHFMTFKVKDDKTMVELSKELGKGRDIVFSVPVGEHSYVFVREFIPTKIALGRSEP